MNPLDRRAAAEEASAEPDRANSAATFYQAGLRHLHAQRYLDAQICCERALEIDPDHADSLHLMGLLSFPQGLYDHAVEWIARAIRRHPKPDYLSNLGTALKRQGRHEEALQVFDKAVQLAPDDARLWARLGDALAEASRPVDAIRAISGRSSSIPATGTPRGNAGFCCTGPGGWRKRGSSFSVCWTCRRAPPHWSSPTRSTLTWARC
jgi:tetratricopeptide (TPR) repeat protein